MAVAGPRWCTNLLSEATNLSQGLSEDKYPLYSIITTELWECMVLSLFDALAKHPHQSGWKKLISNGCFPQRAVGEKQGASPDAQNRHLVIVRLRVTSADLTAGDGQLGWGVDGDGDVYRRWEERTGQSAPRVDAGFPSSGNTGL